MSYEAVMSQVRAVPEACLDEISQYIEYVLYRHEKQEKESRSPKGSLAEFYGALQIDGDPLAIQKEMRDEWS